MRYIQKELIHVDAIQFTGTVESIKTLEKTFPAMRTIFIALAEAGTVKYWRCYSPEKTFSVHSRDWVISMHGKMEVMNDQEFRNTFTEYAL